MSSLFASVGDVELHRAALVCEACGTPPPVYRINAISDSVDLCETCLDKFALAARADQVHQGQRDMLPRRHEDIPAKDRWMGR